MKRLKLTAVIATSVLLAACGEPLDDQEEDNTPTTNAGETTSIQITEGNAKTVASVGFTSGSQSRKSTSALKEADTNEASSVGAQATSTTSCETSGSQTIEKNYQDENSPMMTAGDYESGEFNNCVQTDMRIHGSFKETIESADTNSEITQVEMNMSMIIGEDTVTTKGDMRVENSATLFVLTSNNLSVSFNDLSFSASNLNIRDITAADSSIISTVSGTFSSSNLDGYYVVSTPTPMQYRLFNDDYPYFGVVRYSGANGSYVELNADTSSDQTVQITTNTGTSSTSEVIDWSSLEGLWSGPSE